VLIRTTKVVNTDGVRSTTFDHNVTRAPRGLAMVGSRRRRLWPTCIVAFTLDQLHIYTRRPTYLYTRFFVFALAQFNENRNWYTYVCKYAVNNHWPRPNTKSNRKQHINVSIHIIIVACPTHPETLHVVAPISLLVLFPSRKSAGKHSKTILLEQHVHRANTNDRTPAFSE